MSISKKLTSAELGEVDVGQRDVPAEDGEVLDGVSVHQRHRGREELAQDDGHQRHLVHFLQKKFSSGRLSLNQILVSLIHFTVKVGNYYSISKLVLPAKNLPSSRS